MPAALCGLLGDDDRAWPEHAHATGHLKGAVKGTELALAILRDEPFPAEDLGVLIRR